MSTSERVRLAQELHDGIAQDLVAMGYSLDTLLGQPQTPLITRAGLRGLRFQTTEIIERIRREIFDLRRVNTMEIKSDLINVAPNVMNEIIRISTEILKNVSTHSKANQLDISAKIRDGAISLRIADNGQGGAVNQSQRFGIIGVRERIQRLGGTFEIESNQNGTAINIEIPAVGK